MKISVSKAAVYFCFALVFQAGVTGAAAQAPAKKPTSANAPGKSSPSDQKYKAIWEPVNVKEDVELYSVHFVSPEEGWVSGGRNENEGGVIYHTKDGGATWELQLGEPQSSDRSYRDLRFVNATTGFARQSVSGGDHKLFRTTDGQNWLPVGTVPQYRTDYEFVSSDTGFAAAGSEILRTQDGGKRWQVAYTCRVKAEIQGLTRDVSCKFSKLYFLNAQSGYAISEGLDSGGGIVVAHTTDGGNTWSTVVALQGETASDGALHFVDENAGVLRTWDGKLFRTADGGQTWTGVPGQMDGKPDLEFADAQVGWAVKYRSVTYTSNAGQRWFSANVNFPTFVSASSLPARDRGYAVGEHGMVYRYRIVPVEYTAKGMLPAPAIAGAAK